ncbi:hypothetical protein GCM10010988_27690 [Cnuibacter physcomitrellae]|uniref:Uncharacterized protein n=1 Tax=Cnuibacter physcomitrellae TaxID=1619308 RepID=A0A1X9LFS9_9MICO|nr:hypothetical protein [Cnuibacter physcomitrellae]ARJ04066.1 hypothetical protein B5808_01590 [Cnuibacter physcomitrellae]GGI40160.1 hypothetical protein GCM10010988_27690 [Cnuibacter physcomitrellae]
MAEQGGGEFTAEERKAMKERAAEARASKKRQSAAEKAEADRADALAKIAEMDDEDRRSAERLQRIVDEVAPELAPRTFYGSPAWAKDGRTVFFFQDAKKFKTRYSTLGFQEAAALDEGRMWPTSYAIVSIGDAEAAIIAGLIERAVR